MLSSHVIKPHAFWEMAMATGLLDHLTADIRNSGRQKATLFEGLSVTMAADKASGQPSHLDRTAFRLAVKQMFSLAEAAMELWNDIIDDLNSRPFQKDLVLRRVEQMAPGIEYQLKAITIAKSLAETHPELFDPQDNSPIRLESAQRRFATLSDEMKWWLEALKKPWQPVDEERLAAGLQAAAEGRTMRAKDFVTQLKNKRLG
jgi:hypothetical protein